MKKRIPIVLSLLIIADLYFFQAVKTLTDSPYILRGYWLYDAMLLAGLLFVLIQRRPNRSLPKLMSWLMTLVLLSLVPKLFAMPVLLLEDITRLFRAFPPRTVWVSELAMIVAAL
ncbi:MAG: metallophosphoesterase, partial [Mucilaginibacter sp.]